jgi:hypothetical protein
MLQHALESVEQMVQQNPHDPHTRLEMARLCNQFGEMAFWTGEDRELLCRRSIAI